MQRLALAGDLRTALEREEFVLHYQPKVDLRTNAVSGAEVLLRWAHPVHGWLPPDEFIPLAEHTGLIVPLTNYVLDHALRQMGAWRAAGARHRRRRQPLGAHADRARPARPHRGDVPSLGRARRTALVLEITESMVVADPARALPILARLHELGVEIAVDDFGTGFSSMDYLKRLPVKEVKIDRSFVTTMATDARDAAIVRCTIDLARSLGLRVVAEGVETADVRARLTTMGCDQAQGYSFSRALPAGRVRGLARGARARRAGAQRVAAASALGRSAARTARALVGRGGGRARAGDDDAVVALGGEVAHVGARLGGVARQAHVGVDGAQAGVDERAAVARGGGVDDDGGARRGVVGAGGERGADGQRTGGGERGEGCGNTSHTYEHTTYDGSASVNLVTQRRRAARRLLPAHARPSGVVACPPSPPLPTPA